MTFTFVFQNDQSLFSCSSTCSLQNTWISGKSYWFGNLKFLKILKTKISNVCVSGVRNVSFLENFAYVLNGWTLTHIMFCPSREAKKKTKKKTISSCTNSYKNKHMVVTYYFDLIGCHSNTLTLTTIVFNSQNIF